MSLQSLLDELRSAFTHLREATKYGFGLSQGKISELGACKHNPKMLSKVLVLLWRPFGSNLSRDLIKYSPMILNMYSLETPFPRVPIAFQDLIKALEKASDQYATSFESINISN
jgi:hypothetical protein